MTAASGSTDRPVPETPRAPRRGAARRVAEALGGLVAGAATGVALSLGLVVLRAAVEEVYVHGLHDLLGWPLVPVMLLALGGAVLGARGRLAEPAAGTLLGIALGTALGVLVGDLASPEPVGPWAGGMLGAAAGVLAGPLLGLLRPAGRIAGLARRVHRRTSPWVSGGVAAVLAAGGAAAMVATCTSEVEPLPPAGSLPAPDTAQVGTALLFVGDPGEATLERSPLLERLRRDVERWSGALGPDGRVVVVYLGDLIYPDGLSPPDDPAWAGDSTHLAHQVAAVAGPRAREAGARAIFVAGNHDWGQEEDWAGAQRVVRLQQFLERRRADGVDVALHPRAGTGGPGVLDVGEHVRLVLLDTAWWLLGAEPDEEAEVMAGVEGALATREGRSVIVAAHHPFVSAGPHGTLVELGTTLGVRTLLARSGAMLQDLTSPPYRRLRTALLDVFGKSEAPALFVGGHEHSLQVVRTDDPPGPRTSVVSGSASKLTPVGPMDGLLFARSAPGYVTVLVDRSGGLALRIDATPARYLACPEGDGAAREACMEEGLEAFRTVWTGPL